MLQLSYIRENKEFVKERLKIKNFKELHLIDELIELDNQRKETEKQLNTTLNEANNIAKEIGKYLKSGEIEKANELKQKTKELKEKEKNFKEKLEEIENRQNEILILIPNIPHPSVPTGSDASYNEIIFENTNIKLPTTQCIPHWDIGIKYNILNFEHGVKLTGSGFPVFINKGAKLQRALINFFIDSNVEAGYTEILTPFLVNETSAFGTGQLPDKEGQMYHIEKDNLYLIPTSEVPLTNLYRDTILKTEELPIKLTAYSPCFRREAGSYGKDVRGLNRVHQFDKVEIVQITHPDKSYDALEEMVEHVKSLLTKLQLPFRIVKLCGGDMSFTSALTYDFEVYSCAQDKWLEVSSVSNFETFQSNRMKIRFKEEDKKTRLVHTLNGSALALPRIVAALLENNQSSEGIKLPECLIKYFGSNILN